METIRQYEPAGGFVSVSNHTHNPASQNAEQYKSNPCQDKPSVPTVTSRGIPIEQIGLKAKDIEEIAKTHNLQETDLFF